MLRVWPTRLTILLTIGWVRLGRPLVDMAGNGYVPNLNMAQLINRVRNDSPNPKTSNWVELRASWWVYRMYGLNPNPELPDYIVGPGQE